MNVPNEVLIFVAGQALAVGAYIFKKVLELNSARIRAEILAELNAIKTTPRPKRVKKLKP